MLSLVLLRLSLRDVLAGIPHDAGAVVAYVLLFGLAAIIWIAGRPKPPAPGGGDARHREGPR